jgi:hypothetical protein
MRFNFESTDCFKTKEKNTIEDKIRKVSIECMHKYIPTILNPVLERRQKIPLPQSVVLECEKKYVMVEDVERERLEIDGNNQNIDRILNANATGTN